MEKNTKIIKFLSRTKPLKFLGTQSNNIYFKAIPYVQYVRYNSRSDPELSRVTLNIRRP